MIGKADTKPTSSTADRVAEPEPEQEQRRIGDAGDRRADAHQRQEDILGAARAAHRDADRDARRRPRARSRRRAGSRVSSAWCGRMPLSVSRQNAAAMASSEGNSRAGNTPAPRHDLPDRADDEERERVAPDNAPARLALRDAGAPSAMQSAMGRSCRGVSRAARRAAFPMMKPRPPLLPDRRPRR